MLLLLFLSGNIKNIYNPENKSVEQIIPTIKEAVAIARHDYEFKQAQHLQKEMINII